MTITAGIATIVVISTIGVIGGIGQQQRALASILEDNGTNEKVDEFLGCLPGAEQVFTNRWSVQLRQCILDFNVGLGGG
ncbi:MAG: hypothetical protein ACJ70Z_01305 [Nitrososphaera sp.]